MPAPPPPTSAADDVTSRKRFLLPLVCLALLLAIAGALASVGVTVKSAGAVVLIERLIGSGYAFLWCVGALGLGRFVSPLVPARQFGWSVQLACGLAVALFLAHLLGAIGAYQLPMQRWINAIPMMLGIFLLIHQLRARNITSDSLATNISPWVILTIPALALLWVGASNPPGALWASEHGAYDVLSYHLQLPREWLELGRIATLEHNVYSALPSYMEAAFAQLAGMSPWGARLSTGAAFPLYTAQFLHASFALATALLVARLARECLPTAPAFSHVVGAALFLSTPWVIVTATSAYNEMGVCALLAGALLVLHLDSIHPTARGLILGALLGVACGCKPTAFFMAALPCAVAALILLPRKHWLPCAVATAIGAFVALSPWLVRNWLDTGNPVFPFAADILGSAHWSIDQSTRWNNAHSFHGSLADRLALLLSTERGLLHPQWAIAMGIIALSIPIALINPRTHKPAAALTILIIAQLVAWLFVGHLQARFMIPMLVPGCALVALACAAATTDRALFVAGTARLAFALGVLVTATSSTINFLKQNDANPNLLLVAGAEFLTGADLTPALAPLSLSERTEVVNARSPVVYANQLLGADPANKLYLLGDATPLYYNLPIVYNTTWDTWPLLDAMDRASWVLPVAVDLLRERGITHILINFEEIHRLRESGYIDPRLDLQLAQALTKEAATIRSWIGDRTYTLLLDLNQLPPPPPEDEPLP